MPFTFNAAITRLDGGLRSAFQAGTTSAQKLQMLNELLERFYSLGSWRGVHDTLTLTSTGGILSLPASYLRLDGLGEPICGRKIDIKSKRWQFSPGGPGVVDFTKAFIDVAIDQGDVNGIRKYLLCGDAATNDSKTFNGFARKRYVWAVVDTDVIFPDSFESLRKGIAALVAESEGDDARYQTLFTSALQILDGNLSEFEGETNYGCMQIDPFIGMGSTYSLV